eukprot:3741619-Prorocentrum_lima.AAC.1
MVATRIQAYMPIRAMLTQHGGQHLVGSCVANFKRRRQLVNLLSGLFEKFATAPRVAVGEQLAG